MNLTMSGSSITSVDVFVSRVTILDVITVNASWKVSRELAFRQIGTITSNYDLLFFQIHAGGDARRIDGSRSRSFRKKGENQNYK